MTPNEIRAEYHFRQAAARWAAGNLDDACQRFAASRWYAKPFRKLVVLLALLEDSRARAKALEFALSHIEVLAGTWEERK